MVYQLSKSIPDMSFQKIKSLGAHFILVKWLGEGSNAKVKLVREKKGNRLKVAKIMNLAHLRQKNDFSALKVFKK